MKRQDKAGRAKYQQMWNVTAGVIKSWIPYRLLGGGAPGNGSTEIRRWSHRYREFIRQRTLPKPYRGSSLPASRPIDLTKGICSEVGEKLYAALAKQGLTS